MSCEPRPAFMIYQLQELPNGVVTVEWRVTDAPVKLIDPVIQHIPMPKDFVYSARAEFLIAIGTWQHRLGRHDALHRPLTP